MEGVAVEAKVVSFWPCRQAWVQELDGLGRDDRRFAAETLIRVLAEWAATDRPMAAMLSAAPPLCAVEDLRLICPETPSVRTATSLLTKVVELAQSPRGLSPLGTLNVVRDELLMVGFAQVPPVDELLDELTETLAAVEYLLPRLSADDRDQVADQLEPQLRDVLALLRAAS